MYWPAPESCIFSRNSSERPLWTEGKRGAPAFGDADYRAFRGQRRNQAIKKVLNAGLKVLRRKQVFGINSQRRECQGAFLDGIALVLIENHDHGDGQQHLTGRSKHLRERIL